MRSNARHALFYMFRFAWKNRKSFLLLLGAEQLFYYALALTGILMPRWILSELFVNRNLVNVVLFAAGYAGMVFIMKSTAQYFRARFYICVSDLAKIFQMQMGEINANLDFQYTEDSRTKDLHTRAVDSMYVNGFLGPLENSIIVLREILTVVSVIVVLLQTDLWIVLLCLCSVAFNFWVDWLHNRWSYRQEIQKTHSNRLVQYVKGVSLDFAFGKEIRVNQLFGWLKNHLQQSYDQLKAVNDRLRWITTLSTDLQNGMALIQTGGTYILLALEVVKKGLGIGDFTMYFNAVNQFSNSISAVLKGYLSLSKMSLYVGDLEKLSALPTMNGVQTNPLPLPKPPFTFQFQDVSFRYPGHEDYALRHVNLLLRPEERLALVGANGAGKSTLVKLLLRLYRPTEGRIYLNGVDIQSFDYGAYSQLFSVVFQDYKLFAFSIEENIRFEEEGGEERVWESLEKSGMKEKVESLPEKEKTRLYRAYDEEGIELSGGESQKVGIARALYKDGEVVILDEPTASLDPLSEYEIYRRMDSLVEKKTSIYITHRLSSTRFSDRIVVLEKGRVEEEGSHEELLRRGGLYSRMFHLQADAYSQS